MDRKEAIEILKHEKDNDMFVCTEWRKKIHEALEMAISSLETDEAYQLEYEQPTTKNDLGVDCISRAEVLDLCDSKDPNYEIRHLKEDVECLPSVYPRSEPILDKIRAEIERQEKWLMDAGYNAYNVDIAFNAIKLVVDKYKAESNPQESEDKE